MEYFFDTHYGVSTLTDAETGMVLTWDNGDFEHRRYETDMNTVATVLPSGEDEESFIERKKREMCEYVKENYPEVL